MYTGREILAMVHQLLAPEHAAADLRLLAERCPTHPNLDGYRFAPDRYGDGILVELLKVATREEIIANRLQSAAPQDSDTETDSETDPKPEPKSDPKPAPSKKKTTPASKKKKSTHG